MEARIALSPKPELAVYAFVKLEQAPVSQTLKASCASTPGFLDIPQARAKNKFANSKEDGSCEQCALSSIG